MSSKIMWNGAVTVAVACIIIIIAGTLRVALQVANAQTTGTTGTTGSSGSLAATANANGVGVDASGLPGSPAEQMTAADTIVSRGTGLSQRVTQMLDDARREADVIRVTCLNDKLTQINANLRTAQSRYTSLQRTVDADQRKHELTVLSVLGQKLQVLDQEANQCVGQDLYETGPTKITTEINTSLLPFENDPTNPTITTPTAPTNLGVQFSSTTGIAAP